MFSNPFQQHGAEMGFFDKTIINYYLAQERELSKVVDIFVMVNSGGEKLSASDLMLSVAAGANTDEDIHLKIQDAIEEINKATEYRDNGFKADKELILIAGLMFTDSNSLSLKKPSSYSVATIKNILEHWDGIVDALALASAYLERIGILGKKLTSKNIILPIAYYFYVNGMKRSQVFAATKDARRDRIYIRQWVLRAMINSIFSDGIGSTLIHLRDVISQSKTKKYYPLDRLMSQEETRSILISEDSIEDILEYTYGDGRIMPLLYEVSKNVSASHYDVDHMWPKSLMNKKTYVARNAANLTDDERAKFPKLVNTLPNLELLEPEINQNEKGNREFGEWLTNSDKDDSFYDGNLIPRDIDYSFNNFLTFYEKRRQILSERIKASFPSDISEINQRYNL